MKEAGKRQEVLQKAQLEPKSAVKEIKEKTPPSPGTWTHRYALEVWIKSATSPGNFTPPEEESYSADFILNTLNLTYPGCTGVFLAEPGHAITFYGCKGSVRAGLMVEHSMEACKLISSIPVWMGYAAKIKARAITLKEVNDMIVGLKRLDKEDLKKACMELHHWLPSWRLGNTGSNLSISSAQIAKIQEKYNFTIPYTCKVTQDQIKHSATIVHLRKTQSNLYEVNSSRHYKCKGLFT